MIFTKEYTTKIINQKFSSFKGLDQLPEDLKISTITITCRLDTDFYCENIGKYIDLHEDRITSVYHCKLPNGVRTIKPKMSKRKAKNHKRNFYNQTTVEIMPSKRTEINVKLFRNGAIQMTGCKNITDCVEVLIKLCYELNRIKGILCKKTVNKIIEKPFVSNQKNIDILKIKNFKIAMINSNFDIGFEISRDNLYKLFVKKNINCSYEPIVHACVNIKYNYKNKNIISVFVFESGKIIITGAKKRDHIIQSYKFIIKKLAENYRSIVMIKSIKSIRSLLIKN